MLNQKRHVPNLKNRIDDKVEQAVVQFALDNPAFRQVRVKNELRKQDIFVSPGGGHSIKKMTSLVEKLKPLTQVISALKIPSM